MLLRQGRVLLVEDNEALADNVVEILESQGAEVKWARSGADARHMAVHPFDVALVDVRLPDTSGLELLSQLKSVGDRMAEVLLVTGHGSLEDVIEALDRGAYAYLLKPIHPDELVKSVERALRQARSSRRAKVLARKLEQKESSLRTLVNTVQALLLVLDEEGRVVQVNPAVEAATGVSAEDLVGARWIERFVPEPDRQAAYEVLTQLRSGAPTISYENRIITCEADGSPGVRWIRWQASPHHTGNGEIWTYASGLDSTDLRELERRTRLSERMAAVGTLTAGLAHEVRNPLNAAKLQLDLLERRMAPSGCGPEIREPLHLVKEEIRRLAGLLDEFLTQFARPSELALDEVDIVELARATVEIEQPEADAREIDLQLDLPEEPLLLVVDPDKVRQVLLNLVRNALESLSCGGRVVVKVEPDSDGGRILVRDTGPGIPANAIGRIFEPFFSTKSGGTGLGLAICHSLVAQHGGEIRVVNGGEFTEFAVLLPARAMTLRPAVVVSRPASELTEV